METKIKEKVNVKFEKGNLYDCETNDIIKDVDIIKSYIDDIMDFIICNEFEQFYVSCRVKNLTKAGIHARAITIYNDYFEFSVGDVKLLKVTISDVDVYYICTPVYSDTSCDCEDDIPTICYYNYNSISTTEANNLIESEHSVLSQRLQDLKYFI